MSGQGNGGARWRDYYAATEGRPPRETTLFALRAFAREPHGAGRLAYDLGCGVGRDAVAMLDAGWHVVAVDSNRGAMARMAELARARGDGRLRLIESPLERVGLAGAQLVNASFVLPFLSRAATIAFFGKLGRVMPEGGRLACQLFGPRDSWVRQRRCSGFDAAGVDRLLQGFEVEYHREEESDGTTARGAAKHWHIHHLVARRLAFSPSSRS